MTSTKFERNIEKLRLGGPFKLEPCDCAHFVSLFERYDVNVKFFVSVENKIVILRGEPEKKSLFFEKRAAGRVGYYGGVNLDKDK